MRLQSPTWLIGGLALLLSAEATLGQGTFQNLDFEQAKVPDVPANQGGADVLSTDGVPGWTTFVGGSQTTTILHNDLNLGAPGLAILGPSWSGAGILHGRYSVALQVSFDRSVFPAIAQTGTVPSDARSVRFYSHPYITLPVVDFGGQQIPVAILGGSSSTYYIWGGDISAFAGQTGELLFTGDFSLDNIFFSNLPVPEPHVFGVSALGALLLGWRSLRRRR
jgi:hypothetical protein